MGNKLTGIVTGLILIGVMSPLWMRDVFTDTRRVRLESGREVAVSRWNDGSRTELITGSVAGRHLTDSDNNGSIDSCYNFCTAPMRYPIRVSQEVTSEDQRLYEEALRNFDKGEASGIRGIYSSVTGIFRK